MEKKTRSPNYPAIDLQSAIDRVRVIYEKHHRHPADRDAVAKALGYKGLSGTSSVVISAIGKYGLLDAQGSELRVSERAISILYPENETEKALNIDSAAKEPKLFSLLFEKFSSSPPVDSVIYNYLIREKFSPDAAESAAKVFKSTCDFLRQYNNVLSENLPQNSDDIYISGDSESISLLEGNNKSSRNQSPNTAIYSTNNSEKIVGIYNFEGGDWVKIVCSDNLDTNEALDMVEILIQLKRTELKKRVEII